jgi:hypothetical protein
MAHRAASAPRPFTGRAAEEQHPAMLTVSVQEYDIDDVRPVFGKEESELAYGATLDRLDPRLGAVVTRKTTTRERTNR